MVAAFWRRGSLAALAATLLVVRQASADPDQVVDRLRGAEPRPTVAELTERGGEPGQVGAESSSAEPPHELAIPPSVVAVEPGVAAVEPGVAAVEPSVVAVEPSVVAVEPSVVAELRLPQLKRGTPVSPAARSETLGNVLGRVPTASWAMGCAAGVALAVHALYQNTSDRRRLRMRNCAEDCPDYRVDDYKETRERADVALRLSVFAAASALWLAYNDPQEAIERMGQRKLPREKRGFRVKVKPERRGVWASVVAYF